MCDLCVRLCVFVPVRTESPFTFGCFGPNEDGSVVTQAQCEALYTGCSDEYGESSEVTTNEEGTFWYKRWCPCGGSEGYYSATDPGGSPYGGTTTAYTTAGIWAIVIICAACCFCLGCTYRICFRNRNKEDRYAASPHAGSRYASEPRHGVEMQVAHAREPHRGAQMEIAHAVVIEPQKGTYA